MDPGITERRVNLLIISCLRRWHFFSVFSGTFPVAEEHTGRAGTMLPKHLVIPVFLITLFLTYFAQWVSICKYEAVDEWFATKQYFVHFSTILFLYPFNCFRQIK